MYLVQIHPVNSNDIYDLFRINVVRLQYISLFNEGNEFWNIKY